EDRRVDEQRERQRDRGVDERVLDRFALAGRRLFVAARLHDRGVQVQVVRHHRRAEDADRQVQLLTVGEDRRVRQEARGDRPGRARASAHPQANKAPSPWSSSARRLDSRITRSRLYPKRDPPPKPVAQWPGSMYPTATSYPGPANARALRHQLPSATGTVR